MKNKKVPLEIPACNDPSTLSRSSSLMHSATFHGFITGRGRSNVQLWPISIKKFSIRVSFFLPALHAIYSVYAYTVSVEIAWEIIRDRISRKFEALENRITHEARVNKIWFSRTPIFVVNFFVYL